LTTTLRRWLIAAGITVVLAIAGLVTFWPHSAPLTGAQLGQMTANGSLTTNIDPSTGVQPYGATPVDDYQHQSAVGAHREYPEYYKCKNYPDDADLVQRNLVPTANVVATITYDPDRGKYVVDNDPRITVHEADSIQPANSDVSHPSRVQEFNFGFAAGVHYFATYEHYRSGKGMAWGEVTLYGTHPGPDFYLPVYPGNGTAHSAYLILATDTRTCRNGTVPVPVGFSWPQVAQSGLLLPEYYGSGKHPQG